MPPIRDLSIGGSALCDPSSVPLCPLQEQTESLSLLKERVPPLNQRLDGNQRVRIAVILAPLHCQSRRPGFHRAGGGGQSTRDTADREARDILERHSPVQN